MVLFLDNGRMCQLREPCSQARVQYPEGSRMLANHTPQYRSSAKALGADIHALALCQLVRIDLAQQDGCLR